VAAAVAAAVLVAAAAAAPRQIAACRGMSAGDHQGRPTGQARPGERTRGRDHRRRPSDGGGAGGKRPSAGRGVGRCPRRHVGEWGARGQVRPDDGGGCTRFGPQLPPRQVPRVFASSPRLTRPTGFSPTTCAAARLAHWAASQAARRAIKHGGGGMHKKRPLQPPSMAFEHPLCNSQDSGNKCRTGNTDAQCGRRSPHGTP